MDIGGTLLMMLVAVPAIASVLCLTSSKQVAIRIVVLAASTVCIALALGFLLFVVNEDVSSFTLSREDLMEPDLLLVILDVVLAAAITYIGYIRRKWAISVLAVSTLVVSVYIELFAREEAVGPAFVADYLAIIMLLITNIVGAVICIYALGYMADEKKQRRFFAFMLLFISGMSGAVLSNDLTWLFFFWEVTTLCSYMLISHDGTPRAFVSAERALTYTLIGALAFSAAMVLMIEDFPTLELSEMRPDLMTDVVVVALPLLIIAGLAKSAQVPFQSWLVGAMVAPTPVSALLHSATMVNLGAYLMLRLWHYWTYYEYLGWGLVVLGGFTFLATSILAVRQSNSKRVLAYSTIGNLGLIFVCAGIATEASVAAGMLLLLFHAIAKGLLFLAVGTVKHETGSEDIEEMQELRQRMPLSAFAIYAGVFLILLPPFGLFIAKWMLSEAAVDMPMAAILLAVGFGATTVYYGKWLGRMYMTTSGSMRRPFKGAGMSGYFTWTLLTLIAMGVFLTVMFSSVVSGLVDPFVPSGTDVDVWGTVTTATGSVPVLGLLVVIFVSFVLFAFYARPKKEEFDTEYSCGEPLKAEISGSYIYDESVERLAIVASESVALLVLLILLFSPFIDMVVSA
ncbi:MAG: proton-conducting transporter membrane subunit [Methanomassiliicoccales archaeon]|jgi:ech hydrogenase subunit A